MHVDTRDPLEDAPPASAVAGERLQGRAVSEIEGMQRGKGADGE